MKFKAKTIKSGSWYCLFPGKPMHEILSKFEPGTVFECEIKILTKNRTPEEVKQFNKYFSFCGFMIEHLPTFKDIKFWNIDIVHSLFKSVMQIKTVQWNKFSAEEFSQYFFEVKKWCAVKVLNCDYRKLVEAFEYYLSNKEL